MSMSIINVCVIASLSLVVFILTRFPVFGLVAFLIIAFFQDHLVGCTMCLIEFTGNNVNTIYFSILSSAVQCSLLLGLFFCLHRIFDGFKDFVNED